MNRHWPIPARTLAILIVFAFSRWASPVFAGEVTLQDSQILVAFDDQSGALTRLVNRTTGWTVERRPELATALRLSALTQDYKPGFISNPIQRAAQVQKISDHEIRFQWSRLVGQRGDALAITLTASVTLSGGALTFNATVQNDSPLALVESVEYPFLGDLSASKQGEDLIVRHIVYGSFPSAKVVPSSTVLSRQCLFCLIQAAGQGLYAEMHDPTQPYLLKFAFNQRGSADSTADPLHIEFRAIHVAYVHSHSTARLSPVFMQCYSGDWHAGVDLYKAWRATWFKPPRLPQWVQEVHSWQQLQIDSTEQDYRVPYARLPVYGNECAANGVQAMQLVGWNRWGQDGADPSQDIEPGLGTWQDLHDAIAHIQAQGVKVILFAKLNWADLTMPWYASELYKYQCTDPAGKRYEQGGYAYYTPTQLAGIGVHRRAVMDFLDPRYRAVAAREFQKILALGSEGWLWDEVWLHSSVLYNYAPGHGYTPPGYIYGGDMPLAAQLRAAADKVNPDFLFSGEAPQDWLTQYYPCSYFRISADSVPVCRYIDPHAPLMVAVTGFDDREMLNLILLDRYIISYEPYNFKGHLTDYPLTLEYGKKIDALRRRYREYLWDGEFRDTLGATVTADGSTRHTVFVAAGGKRAVVVANMEFSRAVSAQVDLPNPGPLVMATPEDPQARATSGKIEIPPRCAVVVMEQ